MSKVDGADTVEDLSEDIARIQVALGVLGLTWESPRVQTWLAKAGAWYVRDCAARGVKPEVAPPYPTLMWLPGVLVKKMARAMWEVSNGCAAAGGSAEKSGGGG